MIRELYINKSGPLGSSFVQPQQSSEWTTISQRTELQARLIKLEEEELTISQLLEAKRRRIETVM